MDRALAPPIHPRAVSHRNASSWPLRKHGATFDESERGKAIGTWAGSSAVATAIAPLLGGWIVDHFSWRWIFLINPLLALPTIWIAYRHVPESRDPDAKPGLDWRGTVLVLLGLGGLAYGLIAAPISGWRDPIVLASLTAGVVSLIGFVCVEHWSRAPMLPLTLFRSRTFSAVNLLTLLLYAALGGVLFFLPFALIQVHGYPATLAGAAFLPFTIIMAALSRWAGGLLDRFGARLPLVVGPAIAAAGIGAGQHSWPARNTVKDRRVSGAIRSPQGRLRPPFLKYVLKPIFDCSLGVNTPFRRPGIVKAVDRHNVSLAIGFYEAQNGD